MAQTNASSEKINYNWKYEPVTKTHLTSSESQRSLHSVPPTSAYPLLPQNEQVSSASSSSSHPKSPCALPLLNLPASQNQPSSLDLSKKHAIVIPAHNELTMVDYLDELSKIIPPADIKYAGEISNNRMCFYLSSSALVDKIVETKEIITKVGPLLIKRLDNTTFTWSCEKNVSLFLKKKKEKRATCIIIKINEIYISDILLFIAYFYSHPIFTPSMRSIIK